MSGRRPDFFAFSVDDIFMCQKSQLSRVKKKRRQKEFLVFFLESLFDFYCNENKTSQKYFHLFYKSLTRFFFYTEMLS